MNDFSGLVLIHFILRIVSRFPLAISQTNAILLLVVRTSFSGDFQSLLLLFFLFLSLVYVFIIAREK